MASDQLDQIAKMLRSLHGWTGFKSKPRRFGSVKEEYISELHRQSAEYDVDPILMQSMMKIESGYDPKVVSDKGAVGLMQIMPETAEEDLGIRRDDLFDPKTNINAGVRYAGMLINNYIPYEAKKAGVKIPIDTETVSAAYNMGARGLAEHIREFGDSWRETLSKETKKHIRKVSDVYTKLSSGRKEAK